MSAKCPAGAKYGWLPYYFSKRNGGEMLHMSSPILQMEKVQNVGPTGDSSSEGIASSRSVNRSISCGCDAILGLFGLFCLWQTASGSVK